MFPIFRLMKDMMLARRMPPLALTETHVSQHRCWPWDLDLFLELNNGRAMTLYDLGRLMNAQRVGLVKAVYANTWGLTMAGSTVRFRQRIRGFEKFEMRSRAAGWDDKFVYLEQSMWKMDGTCASHVVFRAAVTDKNGLVAPQKVLAAMGHPDAPPPPLPDWIAAWCAADAHRPWPPMQDALD